MGLTLVAKMVKNLPAIQEAWVWPLGWKDPLERGMVTHPLQYSCLENPREGGAWWAAIYGVAQSRTWLKRLSSSSRATNTFTFFPIAIDHEEEKSCLLCHKSSINYKIYPDFRHGRKWIKHKIINLVYLNISTYKSRHPYGFKIKLN